MKHHCILTMLDHCTLTMLGLMLVAFEGPNPIMAGEAEKPVKITLYPMAASTPALKYRLLPERADQIDGNAVVYYGKVKAEENAFFSNRELRDNIDRWQKTSLDKLVAENARVPSTGGIDFHLDRGARCRNCDWQMPIGDVQFYATLLSEMQESRQFGRILAANARIDIAHGRYEDAIWRFQTNYALGRHVAQGDFIVSGLIGIAICQNMNKQVLEFIQQPDAPVLYWALTALPVPLVDMREAIELEAHGMELSYPELGNYKGVGLGSFGSRDQAHPELWKIPPSRRSPKEWKQFYHAVVRDLNSLVDGDGSTSWKLESELEESCQQVFPLAKRYLGEHGMEAERLASMSMHQVVLLYMLKAYREQVDAMAKYYYLPYPAAMAGFDAVMQQYQESTADVPPELRATDHILSAIRAAKTAEVRLAREIAVLRVFEALRMYGAQHGGKLPSQLADIEVPIPNDPVRGTPFEYRLDGQTALVQGPVIGNAPLHYEISMGIR